MRWDHDGLIAFPQPRETAFLDGCDGVINNLDGNEKAVTLARNCFDESRVFRFVLQRRSKLFQGSIQAAVEIDVGAFGPESLSTLLASHNLAWLLQKKRQYTEGLLLQFEPGTLSSQRAPCKVRLKQAESDSARRGNL